MQPPQSSLPVVVQLQKREEEDEGEAATATLHHRHRCQYLIQVYPQIVAAFSKKNATCRREVLQNLLSERNQLSLFAEQLIKCAVMMTHGLVSLTPLPTWPHAYHKNFARNITELLQQMLQNMDQSAPALDMIQ
jgi:superoxide dismutase